MWQDNDDLLIEQHQTEDGVQSKVQGWMNEDSPLIDFGEKPLVDFGNEPMTDFGQRTPVPTGFDQKPLRALDQNPTTDLGDRPLADFGQRTQTNFSLRSQTDFSQRSQTDIGQRSQTDFSLRSQTDFSQRSQTDFSQRSQTDFSLRSQSDFSQRSQTDFDQRALTDFGQKSQTDFGDRSQTDFGDRSLTDFDQRALTDSGQRSQTDFSLRSQTDFSQTSQTHFSQTSQTHFSHRTQTDFSHRSQTDFGQRSLADVAQRSQTDFGDRSLTDVGQRSQTDFGDRSLTDIGQRSQTDFGDRSLTDVGQRSQTDFGDRSLTNVGQRSQTDFGDRSLTNVGQRSQTDFGDRSLTNVGQRSQTDFGDRSLTNVGQRSQTDFGDRSLTNFGDGSLTNGCSRYTEDGKKIVHEEEWFYKDGRWLKIWIYEDEIIEVEDIRTSLEVAAYARSRSAMREVVKEEVVKEEKVEEQIKGPGMRITIRGPFKVRQRIPPTIKWKKKVQEVKKISRVLEAMEETDSGVETTPTHEVRKLKQIIYGVGEEYMGVRPEVPGVRMYQATLVSSGIDEMHMAKIETVTTEDPSFLQGILRSDYMPMEETKDLDENIDYHREFGQYVDMERNRAEQSVSRSEDPTYNRATEEELRTSLEGVSDVIPGLVYTKPCYESMRQDRFDANARQVLSESPVYLEAMQMEAVVPVESTREDFDIPSTDYTTVVYDVVTQQRFQTKEKFMTSQDAEYHKGVEGSIFLSSEEIKTSGNLESFEYQNLVPKNVDVTVNKAAKVTVRSLDPTYHKADVGEIKQSFNERTDLIPSLAYEMSSHETLLVEQNKASSGIVTSETPQFLEAVEMETVTPVESAHEDRNIPDVRYSTLEYNVVTQQRFQTKEKLTTSQDPTYHKAVEAKTLVSPEEIKDKLESFEYLNLKSKNLDGLNDRAVGTTVRSLEPTYHKPKMEEVKESLQEVKEKVPSIEYETPSYKELDVKVSKAFTTMVTTVAPRYLEAVEVMAIQPIVEAGAAMEWSVIVYVEPQYSVVASDQYKAHQTFTKAQDPTFHKGIERSSFAAAEDVEEFFETFEYHNLNSEYLDVPKNRATETRLKSEDPSFEKAEEKTAKMTLDELEGVVPRIVYERPCYISTKKEVHEAFIGRIPSESPCFYKADEGEVKLRLVSESNVSGLSPITWHQAAETKTDQQVFKTKSSMVSTQIEYHKGNVEKAYLTLEEVKPNIKKLDYLKAATELTKKLDTTRVHASKERSENPRYLQVTEGRVDLKIVPETISQLTPIKWHKAAQETADQSSFRAKSDKVKTEIEYHKVKETGIKLEVEETDDNVQQIRYSKAAVELINQLSLSQALSFKERSQLPKFLEANESKLELQLLPKTSLKKMVPLEFQKLQAADIQKTPFHMVKKDSVSVGVPIHRVTEKKVEDISEKISGKIKSLEYEHANSEGVKQEVLKHHTDTTLASAATYLHAEDGTATLRVDTVESEIAAVGYEQAQAISIPIVPEHMVKEESVSVGVPIHRVTENKAENMSEQISGTIESLEYEHASYEELMDEVQKHDTSTAFSSDAKYHQARSDTTTLDEESVDSALPAFTYEHLEITSIPIIPNHMVKEEAVFANVPIHRATEADFKIESEEVGTINVQEYEKANKEEAKQEILEHQTNLSSSSDAEYLHAELDLTTFEEEKFGPAIDPYELDACTVSTVAVQQFMANTEETQAAAPTFLHAVQNETLAPPEQTRKGEPPIPWDKVDVNQINVELQKTEATLSKSSHPRYEATESGVELEIGEVRNIKGVDYETGEQIPVDQVLFTPISEKTESAQAEYLHEDVAKEEVPEESTGTFDGFTVQEPKYMLIERTECKVGNVALQKTESPQYHKGEQNSVSTDVFQIDGEFEELHYDSPVFNAIPNESTPNVEVGLHKTSVNLITPTEDKIDLELDKTNEGVEPFVVERATIDVEPLQEISSPLYVSQQDAILNPLPIHEAQQEEAPTWEKGEETMFEEMKLTKAKPTVALGQLSKADKRQPKVQFVPEAAPVIASEVSQVQRSIEPPPRRRFRLKEKVLDQPLEETEEIPEIVQNTVEAKEVPKEKQETVISSQIRTFLMDIKFAKEQDEELELGELGEVLAYLMNTANEDMTELVTFGKVEVVDQKVAKLDLPKLEFHEEEQQFTAPDLELAPVPRTLFKQPVENTLKDVDTGTVYEIPDAAYQHEDGEIVFQDPVHTAEANVVDIHKAPMIYYGDENVSNVETGEFEVFAEPFKTSATMSEEEALEVWKALVQESILNMDTLEAEEGKVEEVGLEIISDIAPMSPEEAEEFKLPEELYLEAEHHSLRSSAPLYQSEEGVIELKEQTVATIPPKLTGESAQIIAVPTQRLENVTSSTTEIMKAQHFGDEGVIDAREEYIYIIPPYEEDDAEMSTLPSPQMSHASAVASRTELSPEEYSIYMKEQYVNTIAPESVSDTAHTSTLPHLQMDQANIGSSRMERFPEEHSLVTKEQYVQTIPPTSRGDTANVSSLPHPEMSRAQAEAYRIQQLAREDTDDFDDDSVHGLASDETDKARASNLPHLEMDRARIESYRIQQLAREDTDDFDDDSVHGLASDESDMARESNLPHLEMDRARIESYRIQQLAREDTDDFDDHSVHGLASDESDRAQESNLPHLQMDQAHIGSSRMERFPEEHSLVIKEQYVQTIPPTSRGDTANVSSLPHPEMSRAQAEAYRIQQLAREDTDDFDDDSVHGLASDESDMARESNLPHLEMDRARIESYRVHQLAREDTDDFAEHTVGSFKSHDTFRARESNLPRERMDRARIESYRVHQLAREDVDRLAEHRVGSFRSHDTFRARESNLPRERMDRARADTYRVHQLAKEDVITSREQRVYLIKPSSSERARTSSLPHLQLDKARAESYRIQQLGREQVIGTREQYVRAIQPASSAKARSTTLPSERYRYVVPAPRRRTTALVRVRDVRWQPLEVHATPIRDLHQDRVIAVHGVRAGYPKRIKTDIQETPVIKTEIVSVIPPLPSDAARMGRIPQDVLQQVQVQSVASYQAPAERVIGERVEITPAIPPLPPGIFQQSNTPVDVFRKTHAQHVYSHGMGERRETIPASPPEAQLPPLQHRTSVWRLVPSEGPSSDGPLSPVNQRAPMQQVVTSDDFHRADSSTLHSNWVPAEIQVVGELDSLMQQGIIRYNPLSQGAEDGIDAQGYNGVFMGKEYSGQRQQAWSVYRPPKVQQSENFKVGNIPRVGYPTRQWPSTQSLVTDTAADRGEDDFDYDKIIKMTTGGKHELGDHGEPRSGWSTVSVEGSELSPIPPPEPQMFFKRIPSSQESIYVEQHRPGMVQETHMSQQYQQPRMVRQQSKVQHGPQGRSNRPPFAFDFGRLVHWTVGRQNKIQQLQPERGAIPQHLVPFDFNNTATWTVAEKSPDGRRTEEKTYVSLGVPVRVRNNYFVNDNNDRQQASQSHLSAPPRDNTVHPRKIAENLHWTPADGRDRQSSRNSYQAHESQRRESQAYAPPPPVYPGPPSPGIDASARGRRPSQRDSEDPFSIGYLERRRRSSQASSISDRWLNRNDQGDSDDDNASLHSWSSYDSSQVRKLDPGRLKMFETYKAKKRAKRALENGHI
ncbi:Hypp416 [Branchiostoma lanceolatum]|uniref:Hypp416 protein n=1 Tax=Branchiostoma lanceolatum TaxID=7740 RepID=A0A8J9YQN0_BRALA|nr:Hypp416 [Branchiostoma lanceolatum]